MYKVLEDDPPILAVMKQKREMAYGKSILLYADSSTPSLRHDWKHALTSSVFLDMTIILCVNAGSQSEIIRVACDINAKVSMFESGDEQAAVESADFVYLYIGRNANLYESPLMELLSEVQHTAQPCKIVVAKNVILPPYLTVRPKTQVVSV